MICNENGRCWRERGERRVIIREPGVIPMDTLLVSVTLSVVVTTKTGEVLVSELRV
jgi:hypothetical protein